MTFRRWVVMMLALWMVATTQAQQMTVEDFTRLKRPFWKRSKVTVDKQKAIIDFMTEEKGFTFTANGKEPAEVEEGDGIITVKVPTKTRHITIKHATYGQYTWRVPVKYLKRKKHYKARLIAVDATKEYKLQKQWVVFKVSPENAIVHVDSTVTLVRGTNPSFYLALGSHTYQVEAPFYESVADSFQLADSAKMTIDVKLQPQYSFLTVRTEWPTGDIHIDGKSIGKGEATSQRLMAGNHRLSVFLGTACCYDETISLSPAEKKVVTLTRKDFHLHPLKPTTPVVVTPQQKVLPATTTTTSSSTAAPLSASAKAMASTPVIEAPVTLITSDANIEILVDREPKGRGQWSGKLDGGYHLVTTRKDSIESVAASLWISDSFPQEVNLAVPQTSVAMLNIHSNIEGASIYIDNIPMGVTPCIITGLPINRTYVVRLSSPKHKDRKASVKPLGNQLTDVFIQMK